MLGKMSSNARLASHKIALASTKQKNSVLLKIANDLWNARNEIITANYCCQPVFTSGSVP